VPGTGLHTELSSAVHAVAAQDGLLSKELLCNPASSVFPFSVALHPSDIPRQSANEMLHLPVHGHASYLSQYITSFHWAKSEAQQTKTSASNIPKIIHVNLEPRNPQFIELQ
jgi:hypothetical protein